MKYVFEYQTEIGRISIVEEEKRICAISVNRKKEEKVQYTKKETPLMQEVKRQLEEYLAGKRSKFDLPLKLEGTPFQVKVWEALLTIPYGKTKSYGDIAKQVGNDKAARAVGMANNRNKIIIAIPCHRVIGADKSLVGYGGRTRFKRKITKIRRCFYKVRGHSLQKEQKIWSPNSPCEHKIRKGEMSK